MDESSEEEDRQPARRGGRGKAAMAPSTAKGKKAAVPVKKGIKPRRGQRGRRVIDEESEEQVSSNEEGNSDESQAENSEDQDDDEAGNQKGKGSSSEQSEIEWDEYCYECQDGGNVMCCESCPQVAHYQCIGLRQAPKGDWWCKDCTIKRGATTS